MNEVLHYLVIPALGFIVLEVYRLGRCIAGMKVAVKDQRDWVTKIDETATRADKEVGIVSAKLDAHEDINHK